jgi:hypothetical protein
MYQLQNTINTLADRIREIYTMLGSDLEKVYTCMLKTVMHAVDQSCFPEVESNPILATMAGNVRPLIISINLLLRKRVVESSLYLKNAIDILKHTRNSREPLYIMLCDALSLPEYMFLVYTFGKSSGVDKALCAVNPSGKTATFKYLAKEYLGIKTLPPTEEIVMKNVCEGLREKLRASGASIFRDIDMLIHYGEEYRNVDEMINSLFKIANKLHNEVENWLNNNYKVLITADHGYDVLRNGNVWTLTHRWEREKLCVSPFVPILIMR